MNFLCPRSNNLKLSDFRNKHQGEIAFILGAGPSLRHLDVDLIKDHVTVSINSGIAKYIKSDYFVSDDYEITNWSYFSDYLSNAPKANSNIEKSKCVKFLYDKKFEHKCSNIDNHVLYPHTWFYSPEDNTYNLPGLKLNKEGPIVGAKNSSGSAVHIAYLMGCSTIVLLGNDCRLDKETGFRYFWQFPGEKKQFKFLGRSFESNPNKGFNEKSFKEYWNYFAQVNKETDVNIIDASDSSLDCFPKMTVEEVLKKYKS